MKRNPFMLVATTISAIFVTVLIGILALTFKDEPRYAAFDADFSLVDDRGEAVDKSLFKGSPSLVYFGYTNCPEVCPTTLFEVAGYLQALGDEGKSLKTYFFTIDPERDTPSVMHAYVTAFSNRIRGVTGKPEEMKKVTDGMMIHAARQEGSNPNYHMSHTTSLLMIGADGRLKGLLPYGEPEDEAVKRIRASLLGS
ncbi:SCO family protein [Aliirhizobium terrae]|uniref:SCO family protein n=1 Tax=Terrirhizobium terrae TaxID=2926709 RepID=UPI0025773C90|nr:SCO family protein [Rhizobium sp. CC-CFT758]WJH41684.1 SCO family protein [Rhizobium sp. CC-CFT758]